MINGGSDIQAAAHSIDAFLDKRLPVQALQMSACTGCLCHHRAHPGPDSWQLPQLPVVWVSPWRNASATLMRKDTFSNSWLRPLSPPHHQTLGANDQRRAPHARGTVHLAAPRLVHRADGTPPRRLDGNRRTRRPVPRTHRRQAQRRPWRPNASRAIRAGATTAVAHEGCAPGAARRRWGAARVRQAREVRSQRGDAGRRGRRRERVSQRRRQQRWPPTRSQHRSHHFVSRKVCRRRTPPSRRARLNLCR
jgi:hypothetical protein